MPLAELALHVGALIVVAFVACLTLAVAATVLQWIALPQCERDAIMKETRRRRAVARALSQAAADHE